MKWLYIGICLLIIRACMNDRGKEGSEIIFPPSLSLFMLNADSIPGKILRFDSLGKKDHLKLIQVIDGDCSLCFLSLVQWENYLKRYAGTYERIEFAAVLTTGDADLTEYNIEQMKIKLPFCIDSTHIFIQSNNLKKHIAYTFLVDKDNRILYEGEAPVENRKIHKRIFKLIKRTYED